MGSYQALYVIGMVFCAAAAAIVLGGAMALAKPLPRS
jgi:hypothetical protein